MAVTKEKVYHRLVLTVEQYRWQLPNRDEIVRDIVERPESVIVLPIGQKQNVLLRSTFCNDAGDQVY